jgi:hypothetical protein
LSPRDKELLEGMGNCYSACGDDFDNTVSMVAGARGRTTEDVKETLQRLAKESAGENEYRTLRSRLPTEFPF